MVVIEEEPDESYRSSVLVAPGVNIGEDFKKRVFFLCNNYIGGNWRYATIDNFEISYIKGGLTNYLYLCSLKKVKDDRLINPSQVLLRIYGEIMDTNARFTEGIIFNLLSERGVGPRLLGSFPFGRLEEFIYTSTLSFKEFSETNYIRMLSKVIAEYHMLQMPMNREPKFIVAQITKLLLYFKTNIDSAISKNDSNVEILKYLKSVNITKLVIWLFSFLAETASPVVFCHNDLNEGNVMKACASSMGEYGLRLIDFEYSCYNYRGYDIGNYFNEMMIDNNGSDEYPYFKWDYNLYPTNEKQIFFAESYLSNLSTLIDKQINGYVHECMTTSRKLVEEGNRFSLASHLYWALWGFSQIQKSSISWGFAEYSKVRIDMFLHFRRKFGYYRF